MIYRCKTVDLFSIRFVTNKILNIFCFFTEKLNTDSNGTSSLELTAGHADYFRSAKDRDPTRKSGLGAKLNESFFFF